MQFETNTFNRFVASTYLGYELNTFLNINYAVG